MPAYANEPAWFIGRIDGDIYPQPAGSATLTEHAEVLKAALLHNLSQGDGIVARAFDITVENAPVVTTLDDQVVERHVGVQSLGASLESENVSELTATIRRGDGEHLEPLSVMGFDIFTGDEEGTVEQLDKWSGFNHSLLNTIPLPPGNDFQPPPAGPDQPLGDNPQTRFPGIVHNLAQVGQGIVADIVRLPGAVFRARNGQDDLPVLPP